MPSACAYTHHSWDVGHHCRAQRPLLLILSAYAAFLASRSRRLSAAQRHSHAASTTICTTARARNARGRCSSSPASALLPPCSTTIDVSPSTSPGFHRHRSTPRPTPCLRTLGARRAAPPVCAALDTAVAHRRRHPARCWTPASIVHPEYHKQYLLRPRGRPWSHAPLSPRPQRRTILTARRIPTAPWASPALATASPHRVCRVPHAGMILAAPHLRPCITRTGVRRARGVSPVRRAPPPVPVAPAAAAPYRRRPAHRLPAHPAVDCLGSRPPCTPDRGLTPRSDSGRFSGMQTRRERGFSGGLGGIVTARLLEISLVFYSSSLVPHFPFIVLCLITFTFKNGHVFIST